MKTLNWHNPQGVTSEQLQPEDGWRFLTVEEQRASELSFGVRGENPSFWGKCQGFKDGKWSNSLDAGFDPVYTYRTKAPLPEWARTSNPELPEGLPPLPKLPVGWRWEYKGENWNSAGEDARYAFSNIGSGKWNGQFDNELPTYREANGYKEYHYILAVEDKQEGWIKWSDRQPVEADLPIKTCVHGQRHYATYSSLPANENSYLTHWMHDDTPPIPPRELTQEEKDEAAYSEWESNAKLGERFHAAWCAALAYSRKQP